jgi:hypothetical protein
MGEVLATGRIVPTAILGGLHHRYVRISSPTRTRERFGFLARQDAHNLHGIADHIGGALLAFRSGGHPNPSFYL